MHARSRTFTRVSIAATLIVSAAETGAQPKRPLPEPVAAPAPAPVQGPVQGPVLTRGAVVSRLAAPPAPTGVTVTGTPASATVVWQPLAGVASYVVARKQGSAAPLQAKLGAAATRWDDVGLRPSTAYTYMVDAIYPDGREAYTEVPFTTPPAVNPSGFKATQTSDGKVQLSWQPISGASYYVVLGPGSSFGGVKVSVLRGTPFYNVTGAPAGSQTWAVASYYDPGPNSTAAPVGPNAVSTPAAAFPRITLMVAAASDAQAGAIMRALNCTADVSREARNSIENLGGGSAGPSSQTPCPPASATAPHASAPANAPAASGRYVVVANGFRVMHETFDDQLSRDGKYDEVYAAFTMFQYDRKTSRQVGTDLKKTLIHGEAKPGDGRVKAGTASASGGLKTGDMFPQVADPSQRYGAALSSSSFPFLVWQGSLTEGQDAVIILPTMWESDGNTAGFSDWFQNGVTSAPRIWADVAVQQAITAPKLALVSLTGNIVTTAGPTSGGAAIAMFLTGGASLLFTGSWDRPIGLQRSGPVPVLPRRAIVLTREMIESAFATSAGGGTPPGRLDIQLVDAPGPDLQGSYVLYIQVERIP